MFVCYFGEGGTNKGKGAEWRHDPPPWTVSPVTQQRQQRTPHLLWGTGPGTGTLSKLEGQIASSEKERIPFSKRSNQNIPHKLLGRLDCHSWAERPLFLQVGWAAQRLKDFGKNK